MRAIGPGMAWFGRGMSALCCGAMDIERFLAVELGIDSPRDPCCHASEPEVVGGDEVDRLPVRVAVAGLAAALRDGVLVAGLDVAERGAVDRARELVLRTERALTLLALEYAEDGDDEGARACRERLQESHSAPASDPFARETITIDQSSLKSISSEEWLRDGIPCGPLRASLFGGHGSAAAAATGSMAGERVWRVSLVLGSDVRTVLVGPVEVVNPTPLMSSGETSAGSEDSCEVPGRVD